MKRKILKLSDCYLVVAARGKRIVYGLDSFDMELINPPFTPLDIKIPRERQHINLTGALEQILLFQLLGKRNKVKGKKAWNSYLDSLKVGRSR
jgi:hypothetical protein